MKRIKLGKYKYLRKKYGNGNANDKNMNLVEVIRRWESWFGISNYKARSNVKKMGNIYLTNYGNGNCQDIII